MANTANRGYPMPVDTKSVKEEIENLQQNVLPMLDNDVQALFDAIAGLAPLVHSHAIGDITGLTTALAGKMPASTTFALSDLTDVVGSAEAPDGYVLAKVGAEYVAQAALAALGPHGHTIAQVSGLGAALDAKADDAATTAALGTKAPNTSVVVHDAVQSLTPLEQGQARANIEAGLLSGHRNKLANGDGQIAQRVLGSVTSPSYSFDRHRVRAQTAAIATSARIGMDLGVASMMRITQSAAAAQRMGQSQTLEGIETYALRGKLLTLGGKAKLSIAGTIRFAVVEWTGAVDAVGATLILDWTSASYTAGGFFNATTMNVLAVGSKVLAANTLADFAITATPSAAATNLVVFYWTESTVAQNVTLDMRWYLVEGDATAEADPFSPRPYAVELALCHWFYEEQAYNIPAMPISAGILYNDETFIGDFIFLPKRADPSISYSSASDFTVLVTGASITPTLLYIDTPSRHGKASVTAIKTAAFTAGQAGVLRTANSSAKTKIYAEL